MINEQILNLLCDRIEQRLSAVSTDIRIVGSKTLPQFLEFIALPVGSTTYKAIAARHEDIALAIGRPEVRIAQDGVFVSIQVPINERRKVLATKLMPHLQPGHTALLGQDEKGQVIQVKLSSPAISHVLIAGTTGSGKTELAKTMLCSLVQRHKPHQLGLIVIDPKRRENKTFEQLIAPNLLFPIATSEVAIVNTLHQTVNLVDRRKVGDDKNIRMVILVDEMADICASGGAEVVNLLTHLVARGREVDVHLIGCTQKPTARSIDTVMKANFPFRIVMKVMSPDDAKVAAGVAGTGAEHLTGSGDAVACYSGMVKRFQAAYCDFPAPVAQVLLPPPEPEKRYKADATDPLQVQIAEVLNDSTHYGSIRSLQRHISTLSGKSYSGGANYWKFISAAAAVGWQPAVESWKQHEHRT